MEQKNKRYFVLVGLFGGALPLIHTHSFLSLAMISLVWVTGYMFEFAGGNIKNCILNAAFLAAADGDGKQVHMKHYLLAIKYEFVKTGKVFTRADFEPYASQIGLV